MKQAMKKLMKNAMKLPALIELLPGEIKKNYEIPYEKCALL